MVDLSNTFFLMVKSYWNGSILKVLMILFGSSTQQSDLKSNFFLSCIRNSLVRRLSTYYLKTSVLYTNLVWDLKYPQFPEQ